MNLSRIIPARVETVEFDWCKQDFAVMSDSYSKGLAVWLMSCHWCGKPFKDGDKIALAARKCGGDVVLCEECADKLTHSEE